MEETCLSTDEISGHDASGHPVLHNVHLWQSSTDECFLLPRSLFQARDIYSFPQHKQWGCPPTVTTLLRYITRAHHVLCSEPDMGPKMKSNDIIETVLCRLGTRVMIKLQTQCLAFCDILLLSSQPQCNAYVIVLRLIYMFCPIPNSLVHLC